MVAAALMALASNGAVAGNKPLYKPVPSWVLPAPPINLASLTDASAAILVLDQQQKLEAGRVWVYQDTATRVSSEQALIQLGTIKLDWSPDHGDLIVHRVQILRGGQTIDLLKSRGPLSVLRRELGLEQLLITGVLTATMSVPGLQVGDVLCVSYSTTSSDPALRGAMDSIAFLPAEPVRIGFARARILWRANDDVRWKALSRTAAPKMSNVGNYRELTVALPLAKQPDIPGDAPQRYRPLPLLELSTFPDWQTVSRTVAPLFVDAAAARPGSPLAAEIARIAAASGDPRVRTALALQSVQGNIRYLAISLDHGNLVPQLPERTWAVRYGDCKAKTVLLLTMLKGLGVAAEPVLANLGLGDYLDERLPSARAFNHILVLATVDGKPVWLDGTGGGARLADLDDTPNLRWVLPLRRDGAPLQRVVTHADARPRVELAETIDLTAGIGVPAPFKAEITLRGPIAEQMKSASAQITEAKRRELIDGLVRRSAQPGVIVTRDLKYDDATGTVTIHATGITSGVWARDDQRYQISVDRTLPRIGFSGDRARVEWKAIPVATSGVNTTRTHTTILLPARGTGFALEGERSLPTPVAGVRIQRMASLSGTTASIDDRTEETAIEIAPANIPATRARVTQAKSRALKLLAPRDYPPRWRVVGEATRSGALKPLDAALGKAIAEAEPSDKPAAYRARAEFRAGVFDRKGAIEDLSVVIATRPDIVTYLARASLRRAMRDDTGALADAKAAYALDPGSLPVIGTLARLQAEQGQRDAAMAMIADGIATGGEQKAAYLSLKAELLGQAKQADEALAAADEAIAAKPGDAELLNNRCWLKGTLGVKLDTALRDCTKAIELGDAAAQALDSRAMVYLKMGRLDDAKTDLDAALDQNPELAQSLFVRAVIEKRQGAAARAAADLAGARLMLPRVDEDYARYGVKA